MGRCHVATRWRRGGVSFLIIPPAAYQAHEGVTRMANENAAILFPVAAFRFLGGLRNSSGANANPPKFQIRSSGYNDWGISRKRNFGERG